MSYGNILVSIAGSPFIPQNSWIPSGLTQQSSDKIFVNETGDQMRGPLDMQNNRIKNIPDPVDETDPVNKKWVISWLRDNSGAQAKTDLQKEIKLLDDKYTGDISEINLILDSSSNTIRKLEQEITTLKSLTTTVSELQAIVQEQNKHIATIFIRPDKFTNAKTYFNHRGIIMNDQPISTTAPQAVGKIINIQAVYYGMPDSRGSVDWEEKSKDFIKERFNVEKGFLCYFGNTNPNGLRSGDYRVIVLVGNLNYKTPFSADNRPDVGSQSEKFIP